MNVATMNSIFKAICCCHKDCRHVTGIIISASPTALACGLGIVRLGDISKASCGEP